MALTGMEAAKILSRRLKAKIRYRKRRDGRLYGWVGKQFTFPGNSLMKEATLTLSEYDGVEKVWFKWPDGGEFNRAFLTTSDFWAMLRRGVIKEV